MIFTTILTAAAIASQPATEEVSVQELCETFGQVAEQIMTDRQSGEPMSELMAHYTQTENNDTNGLTRAMIIDAYNQPAYRTQEMQTYEISNFRNNVELVCYESFGGA